MFKKIKEFFNFLYAGIPGTHDRDDFLLKIKPRKPIKPKCMNSDDKQVLK